MEHGEDVEAPVIQKRYQDTVTYEGLHLKAAVWWEWSGSSSLAQAESKTYSSVWGLMVEAKCEIQKKNYQKKFVKRSKFLQIYIRRVHFNSLQTCELLQKTDLEPIKETKCWVMHEVDILVWF